MLTLHELTVSLAKMLRSEYLHDRLTLTQYNTLADIATIVTNNADVGFYPWGTEDAANVFDDALAAVMAGEVPTVQIVTI